MKTKHLFPSVALQKYFWIAVLSTVAMQWYSDIYQIRNNTTRF
jgi:hypothetical protein